MKDDDFTKSAMPATEVPQGALTNTPEARAKLRGAMLRHYLDAGDILMAGDVLHPRDRGFLAAVLAPGARAISIGVDAVSGDGGLVWPGDKVDMILTQQLDEKEAPLAKRFVGETILHDVRVVAVDQNLAQGAVPAGENSTGHLAHTVTLEVTTDQAERAAVAERLGRITLAIRAADEAAEASGPRSTVYGGDVSPALGERVASGSAKVRVVEGKDTRDVTF
jgi:pilus assembly protein CpaB